MTVEELAKKSGFTVINLAQTAGEKNLSKTYCCDLLSIAMTKVPEGAAWVTVMSNINTLAVAALTEAGCVILAENVAVEPAVTAKAAQEEINILHTDLPVFDAALLVHRLLNAESGV